MVRNVALRAPTVVTIALLALAGLGAGLAALAEQAAGPAAAASAAAPSEATIAAAGTSPGEASGAEAAAAPVPEGKGALALTLRSRTEAPPGSGQWQAYKIAARWDPAKTAAVICDMWNEHWCKGATARVAEMAPRMNELVKALRGRGVLIIHCPSDTMAFYAEHPGRKLAQAAPKSGPPAAKPRPPEPPLPVGVVDGGCTCQPPCPGRRAWKSQIAAIEIADGDAITDSAEALYLMRARGITNVFIMGVHTNMCVLNRPFAIRRLVAEGFTVALFRDMTDTMYNSRGKPFVDHFTGTDLVIEHIEKYLCPTLTSDQVLGGKPLRFSEDQRAAQK
ncbi:MAG: protein-signal peptide and transmembrane prediction [Planctomycetes bacterium]|nr:protein-signal peptide and transmembrane prediction [Planctomycetota bacterium]